MLNLSHFKNIIFDFGGILLSIFPEKTREAFRNFGFINPGNQGKLLKTHIYIDYEKGLMSDAEFRQKIGAELAYQPAENEFDKAWNAMLGDYIQENVDFVRNLSASHRLFLLSNSNSIHYRFYEPLFFSKYGFSLNSLFEKTYFSQNVGLRKPDSAIFELVLKNHGLLPEKTLFIDDMPENREAAKSLGIKTTDIETNSILSEKFL